MWSRSWLTCANGTGTAMSPRLQSFPITAVSWGGDGSLSALQLEQMKYFAMLRYVDTTVAEVDFSTGSYHVVYAPDERIKKLFQGECLKLWRNAA